MTVRVDRNPNNPEWPNQNRNYQVDVYEEETAIFLVKVEATDADGVSVLKI